MANSSQHSISTPHSSQFHFQLLHSHSHFLNQHQSSPSSFTHENPLSSYPRSAFAEVMLKQNNEKDNHEVQYSGQATFPPHSKLVADSTLDPHSSTGSKRSSGSKVPKDAKFETQRSNAESIHGLNPATGCRYDSSLGLLTKKFVQLIQDAKDGTLDLNRTADMLEVQKRRIYDITNVLEGIALIEKTSKNHIRWKGYGGCGPKELYNHVTKLKTEVESLRDEELRLDESIREKQELLRALKEDENNKRHLFLMEEDITSLPCFQNGMLIAIKAPQASYLEVPDPDGDIGPPQYKMIARSNTGPIDVYLLRVESEDQQNDQNNVAELSSSAYSKSSGIQKIIPSDYDIDDDYWFQSNPIVSISELWGTESVASKQ